MPSQSIGARLRAERTGRGWSLDDVAQKTRISKRFLTALEADDMSAMPGLAFARGFVKTYSNLLELDAEELLALMPRADAIVTPVQEPHERDPFLGSISSSSWDGRWDPRWNGTVASAAWVIFAIVAAVGGYYYLNRPTSPQTAVVAVKPEPAKAEAPKAAPPKTEPKTEVVKVPEPVPQPVAVAPPPATRQEPTASTRSDKPVQVVLTATESSWLNIIADGKAAFTGVMNANEKKEFAANSNVKIVAGNAGGVRILLNGKILDPIGTHGQVRTVKLTADGPQL